MPLFLTLGCCLFYSAFLGDIFTPLLSLLLPSLSLTRTAVLITLAIVPLAPLCLLDDLSSLQVSSFAGLGGILYTICFVGYRAVTGGYKPGGGEPGEISDKTAGIITYTPLQHPPKPPSPSSPTIPALTRSRKRTPKNITLRCLTSENRPLISSTLHPPQPPYLKLAKAPSH